MIHLSPNDTKFIEKARSKDKEERKKLAKNWLQYAAACGATRDDLPIGTEAQAEINRAHKLVKAIMSNEEVAGLEQVKEKKAWYQR